MANFNLKSLCAMSIALKLKGVPRIVDTVAAQNLTKSYLLNKKLGP